MTESCRKRWRLHRKVVLVNKWCGYYTQNFNSFWLFLAEIKNIGKTCSVTLIRPQNDQTGRCYAVMLYFINKKYINRLKNWFMPTESVVGIMLPMTQYYVACLDMWSKKTSFNSFPGNNVTECQSISTHFLVKLWKEIYWHFHIPKWPYHISLLLVAVLCQN